MNHNILRSHFYPFLLLSFFQQPSHMINKIWIVIEYGPTFIIPFLYSSYNSYHKYESKHTVPLLSLSYILHKTHFSMGFFWITEEIWYNSYHKYESYGPIIPFLYSWYHKYESYGPIIPFLYSWHHKYESYGPIIPFLYSLSPPNVCPNPVHCILADFHGLSSSLVRIRCLFACSINSTGHNGYPDFFFFEIHVPY